MSVEKDNDCQLNPISCGPGEADSTSTFYRGNNSDSTLPDAPLYEVNGVSVHTVDVSLRNLIDARKN